MRHCFQIHARRVIDAEVPELALEVGLEVGESFLAHEIDFRNYALVQLVLPLHCCLWVHAGAITHLAEVRVGASSLRSVDKTGSMHRLIGIFGE